MNFPARKSPRAFFLDYNEGCYFVTICTKNHQCFFGEIYDEKMHLSVIGAIVEDEIARTAAVRPSVEIPLYVVMPNHLHMIVEIKTPSGSDAPDGESVSRSLLGRFVAALKAAVSRRAKAMNPAFEWQARYHDHAIRSYLDGNKIADYINTNVIRWNLDEYHVKFY